MLRSHSILDVKVHTIAGVELADLGQYQRWVLAQLEMGKGIQVVTCNAEMVMLARRDPRFAALLSQADLLTPDGAGVAWALRRQGVAVQRVPGIELAEALTEASGQRGWGIALIGGRPEVSAMVAQRWQQVYPQARLLVQHGYFSTEEEATLLGRLAQERPRLVLVGLGSPRQEYWIQAQRRILPESGWMGVGGSFDIWAGAKERAPRWLRDHQLEWLYRLYQEPWRWRRMLALPQFAWQVVRSQHPAA